MYIDRDAVIQVTGLRNPCGQLDHFQAGLKAAVLDRDANGNIIRKAGIIGIIVTTGEIFVGDTIQIRLNTHSYPINPWKKYNVSFL